MLIDPLGTEVRVVKLVSGFSVMARGGVKLDYVPIEVHLMIQ